MGCFGNRKSTLKFVAKHFIENYGVAKRLPRNYLAHTNTTLCNDTSIIFLAYVSAELGASVCLVDRHDAGDHHCHLLSSASGQA